MTDAKHFYSDLLNEGYEMVTHKSGLRVLVCPKDMAAAYAMLGVGYGSADAPLRMPHGLPAEEQTPLGVAHFLEHKMFEEADGSSCDLAFAALGAEVNAYTSYDRTVYYISCTRNFEKALRALLDLVSELHVTKASVLRERSIIAEEIRMNDDSPFERCYAEMLRAMYHSHRVREEICGTEASLSRITPKLLQAHFDAYYRPEAMVLAVSGRVDIETVLSVVEARFGAYEPKETDHEASEIHEPPHPYQAYTEMGMQVTKPLFCIGIKDTRIPEDPHAMLRRDLCMTILSEMLFSRSGEFYSELFESEIITPAFSYGSAIGKGYGYFAVSGESDEPRRVYEALLAYVSRLRREGLSREDFERSRRILYGDFITGFDSTEDIAQALLTYAMDGVDLFEFIPTVTSITLEEVTALFNESFIPEQFVLSVVLPSAPPDGDKPAH